MRHPAIMLLVSLLAAASPAGSMAQEADDEALELRFEDVPEHVPESRAGKWYLRGDTGYAFSTREGGNSLTGSVGVGYQFNDWLRADTIFSMQRSAGHSGFVVAEDCGGGAGTHCRIDLSARATLYSALVNVYVDLGTVAGFTPYIGAGAGLALVNWGEVERSHGCAPAGNACAVDMPGPVSLPGKTSWRPAYALDAGLAYDLDHRLKLDFGYRFSHVGAGGMAVDTAGFNARDDGFTQHELRFGLRYSLQ